MSNSNYHRTEFGHSSSDLGQWRRKSQKTLQELSWLLRSVLQRACDVLLILGLVLGFSVSRVFVAPVAIAALLIGLVLAVALPVLIVSGGVILFGAVINVLGIAG